MEIQRQSQGEAQHLGHWNDKNKRRHALHRQLADVTGAITPRVDPDRTHVFHLYVTRVARRAELQEFLTGRGIQTLIHYPVPVHRHAAYADLGYPPGRFPVSERLSEEVLSLPMFAELTEAQIATGCDAIRAFFQGGPS